MNKNFHFSIFNFQFRKKDGFTLIEILIVIAIIGMLSTLSMVNFIAVIERGRDAERKSNLRQIQSALELYRADEDSYPSILGNCSSGTSLGSLDCKSVYLKKLPKDPRGSSYYNNGAYYYTSVDGNTYSLVACIENHSGKDSNVIKSPPDALPAGTPTDCSSGDYYVLQNP